jgi:hypothetical protein
MISIRKLLGATAMIAGVLIATAIVAHTVARPISISISTEKAEFNPGDTITLFVRYRNGTSVALDALKLNDDSSVLVTNENGVPIPKTLYGKCVDLYTIDFDRAAKAGCPSYTSNGPVSIDPGEELKDFYAVSNLYDMTKPGRYRIFVRSKFPLLVGTATSNIVTVTVKGQ